jgi:hypothetical protein
MVLMTREGGSASESLLAVGVRALVRSLSGMDSSMASQRAGITEGLFLCQLESGLMRSEQELTFPHRSHM